MKYMEHSNWSSDKVNAARLLHAYTIGSDKPKPCKYIYGIATREGLTQF